MIMTLAYSIAGLGIAIVNDFKSIEGDKALGLKSLPVVYGVDTAKWICVSTIDGFQLLIAAYLWAIDSKGYAAVLLLLIIPQVRGEGGGRGTPSTCKALPIHPRRGVVTDASAQDAEREHGCRSRGTAVEKFRIVTIRVWHGATENGP
jgi:hypothetical protein